MNDLPAADRPCPGAALYLADCRDVLPTLPSSTYDLVFSDPPYPCIKRDYGTWTEAGWWEVMRAVVPQCMRVLKPTGSAVFVLQPNSERVGRMRTWHLKFQLWVAETWGIVQDAYWWNPAAMPTVHCNRGRGLLRPSVKTVVWVGPPGCYRNQDAVLWEQSDANKAVDRESRALRYYPSGLKNRKGRQAAAADDRGGVTPFNLLPMANTDSGDGGAGCNGHGAGTPFDLCWWWVRYLSPPGGAVLDPFSGTATTGLAALKHGCDYTGVERVPEHHATACRRLADAAGPLFATPPAAGVPGS